MQETAISLIHTSPKSERCTTLNKILHTCPEMHNSFLFLIGSHRMESTVIHKFQHPGVFTVEVECSTSDWHVSAEKSITIQEPVGGLSVTRCYSSDVATDGTKCNALLNMPVYIQLQVEAGESVLTLISASTPLIVE